MLWDEIVIAIWNELEFVIRLLLACLCGSIVGWERSHRRKEAGIRTHIIVALGAAMMMIVSKYAFFDVISYRNINVDASRIAANVITGISFLGAGVIFVKGITIRGLTTAAGIWTTAGVGLAIGAGLYIVGIVTTVLVLIIQIVLHEFLQKLDDPIYEIISVTYHSIPNGLDLLKQELKVRNITIQNIKMEKNADETVTVTLQVSKKSGVTYSDLADLLAKNPLVKSFSL